LCICTTARSSRASRPALLLGLEQIVTGLEERAADPLAERLE
jgi:hypothetical protein